MENHQNRGRFFDYFIGLLFNQLPDVTVIVGEEVATGEIDVYVSCIDSPDWLVRIVGSVTAIENKWEDSPVETSEIEKFHSKMQYVPVQCSLCYFVGMGGFTSKRGMGANHVVLKSSDPSMIAIRSSDVERMISDATPEQLLRDRLMM